MNFISLKEFLMARITGLSLLSGFFLALTCLQADDPSAGDDPKVALQSIQDYIGGWKGNGFSEKEKSSFWDETASWSWRFKGKDVWMSVDMDKSKLFKSGEMRWLKTKGQFQLTLIGKDDAKKVFVGEMKKGTLTLESKDKSGDVEQLKMALAAGNIRMISTFSTKPADRTLFSKTMTLSYTKEGEKLAGVSGGKKPECVVTGGLGTMAVSYQGMTYFVCCTGCRDAFNENPAKILLEYAARKKAEKGK